jgi:hypothetical protein
MSSEWIHGVWFVQGDDKHFFAKLIRTEAKWIIAYNFRYYLDDEPFIKDSKDVKRCYRATGGDDSEATREKMLRMLVEKIIPSVEQEYGSKADYVHLDCDVNDGKVLFELGSREWANFRREPA